MSSSYQSSTINGDVNTNAITTILTTNQNVASASSIINQSQYVVIGTINCGTTTFTNNISLTVMITGQMTSQTASDISDYITSSVQASLDQSTNVTTELLGIAGSNVQKATVNTAISTFCQQQVTTQNLQSIMASTRVSQTQTVVIQNITGTTCTITNTLAVNMAAQAIMTNISSEMLTNDITSDIADAVSQYYKGTAKGLNSLVSAALTALLLPVIIVVVAIVAIIILVVVIKLASNKRHGAVVEQARTLGLNPTNPDGDTYAIQQKLQQNQARATLAASVAAKPTTPSIPSPAASPLIPGRPNLLPPPVQTHGY